MMKNAPIQALRLPKNSCLESASISKTFRTRSISIALPRVAPSDFEKEENGFQSQYLVHFNEAEKTTRTEDCSGTFTSPRYGWGKLDTMCHKYYYLENHITEGYTQQCVGDNVETKLY